MKDGGSVNLPGISVDLGEILRLFVAHAPGDSEIAALDRELRYLAASPLWRKNAEKTEEMLLGAEPSGGLSWFGAQVERGF